MAQAEDVTYEKITSTDNLTDGEYLIVYENGNVAFNGALTTLDAVDNVTAVTIESGAITGSEAINAATFTIVNTDNGYTIQSASGKFIGITSYSNGLKQADAAANGYYHSISFDEGNAVIKVTTSSGDMTLRFNSASNQNRFRYYKSGQQAIALYKKVAGGQTDNRVATSITLVNPTTKAAVGDVVALPSAELKAADESNITDAVITWESSDETVAAFVDNTETGMKELKALKAGTATITAKYAGNTTYKESSASFTLTVKEYTQYTTIAEMLENITSTKTDIKYTFSGLTVTYVNGKYTYIYKSGDGAMLLYGDNLGLEEGCVYNGSLVGQLYTYNGLPEIAVSANDINVEKQDGMIAIAITLINPDELPNYINKQCAIQHAEYVSTASGNMTFTVGDKAFIVRNSFGIDLPELTEGKKYFIEGFGAVYTKNNTTTYQLYPTNVTEEQEAAVEFQDFEITNEQLSGALDTSTLPACVTFNGTQRNDSHGYGNVTMSVVVNGPVKFTIGGCQYANPANCKVTNVAGELLAEPYVKTATCYHQDGAAVTYEYTGEATTLTFSDIAYLPYFKAEAFEPEPEPVVFQDFEITNEQMSGEFDASTLPACATFQGTQRGDSHGYGNVTLTVAVNGPVKFTIGGCQYANPATCKVTNAEGELLAEPNLKTATCYHQDGAAAIYEYKGEATTLTFSDIAYLPYFKAEAFEPEPEPVDKDITGTWSYGNATVMSETIALSGSNEAGEVNSIEGTLKMTVEANGATFRNNGDNIQVRSGAVFKVPVRAAGDLITVVGYPGYSYYTIGDSEELNNENTYKAKGSDAERGYVAITSTNDNNYFKSISVVQYAPKEKITLDNEPATATFPFNEGTEGQKATFSNADYFLSSKVKVGSNWSILDKTTYAGTEETRLTPVDQHDTDLTDADAVSFIITPKPGFVFTPTKVSFKANRFGTDNGLIDAYWQNANGTTVELEKGIKPERNNSNLNTEKAYDITGATAGEGACGLKLFLYHLQAGKQIGLADIVIEGILNGTEKDVPVLASFKINGKEYAAEDVFGEQYEATLELSKAEAMVSENNPLTDVTAKSGEVGTITYEEKESACTVTIPMTAGETLMDYVLNVVFKPDFTLSYLDVEGNVLKTQAVEKDAAIGAFAYDINEVAATKDGYKARGWFKTGVLGEKFTTADVITADTKLYAIQTEIEVSSTHKKYNFDLTDKLFYAEDHEAFNPAGEGYYWHDGQHGWAFKNGNTVDLLVGPKATITVTLCQYGSGTGIVVKKGDQTLAILEGKAEGDGGTAVYSYEGEPGTLTLEMQCGGEMYIHAVKIVNTTEVNFDSDGNWYFVKAGDAGSLIDVIDVVNGVNASRDAQRSFIFLPNGTYDLDATVKTAITGHNISLIGESMDKTIIVTKPDKSIEGLGKADLFDVSGTNLYMQDLTLKNALDYYNAGSAGRAAVLQDAGNRTIGKNVRMLSYQDTYYSSNSSQQAYWEDCDIHGTVDFICGGGDIRFQNTTISLEPRAKDGKGGRTIVAPTTNTNFGYVFDGCTIVDLSEGKGDWNFGRTWQNEPITVYLNTTLDDVAKNTLISKRWTEKGMNNKDPKVFGEFATKDASGTDITPASNTITSFGGTFETILTAEQAAEYSYEKMFTNWHPASLTEQIDAAMLNPVYENGNVSFAELDNGMQGCAIFKNGEFVAISGSGYAIAIDPATDELTVRVVNMMGGFGPAAQVAMTGTSIQAINAAMERGEQVIYNLSGQRVNRATKGLYIINGKKIAVK